MINAFNKLEGQLLPAGFRWLNEPPSWEFQNGELKVHAAGKTDFFRDPAGLPAQHNGHFLYTTQDGDFTFSLHTRVEMLASFDAGCLLVMVDEENWAKLCMEFCYEKPMIVSVVTRGVSDDALAMAVPKEGVHLRVTRFDDLFAFHYSLDGRWWELIRYFTLPATKPVQVGLVAQSPTGYGCQVRFAYFNFSPKPIRKIRTGE